MMWLLKPETLPEKLAVMVVAILLFAVVMGLVLAVVDRPRLPKWVPVAGYLGPALLLITFGLLWPGMLTIRNSFYDHTGNTFVGWDNFAVIFTDEAFLIVIRNTLLWVALVPTLATALGLVYAVLVDRTRVEKFAKTLIFLPMAISMVGASIIWKFVYEYRDPGVRGDLPQIGLLNQIVVWMGGEPQQWLLIPPANTFMLIIVMIWIQAGFAMTVLSAAIKAIPDETIEAAKVDGAMGLRLFFFITVPSVRPAIIVVLTTIAMGTLKAFDIVYTMAAGGNFDTSIIANEFYTQSFNQNQQNIGAALAVLLFVMVVPIVVYNVRQMRISEGER
ncbi:carbohydrate ABC transporter permease [Propionicimonas sp.]|uniref:carbohydrate ABC transporter permease n=1 Tax=Propionicimonas sp. TaxID=1955623 RepID=UPI00184283B5|nr:sugar ABC transporter permease [Propionicimonas sp.]MBU3977144.1 sugar ABC transporter permease [Actinomycetota bacterium]MBA3020711.1 sugar ABC transporter permease [Propionicimonas sp.]MBU3985084.1 sugar ABC transporter permease [Actinomycetota bacterium]MBU4006959.1 sugar ABC transporter permease [Actinomycetota bacterium]MBU4064712.1 sugar ABC transporter permease [Actinomycetota bacterium]